MKTLPPGLAAHVSLGSTTLAHLLKITRADGKVFAFTSADRDVVIAGVHYLSSPGLDISKVATSAGLNVDNLELTTLDDGSLFIRGEVLDGAWDNANFLISRYNFKATDGETEPIMAGTLGNVNLNQGHIVVELRGLQQYLQQPVGAVTSRECRARLGDSLCRKDLTAFTFSGTIDAAAGSTLADSARTEAADYFAEGTITFTSGSLNGQTRKIKSSSVGFLLLASTPFQAIVTGDTYTIVAGCHKRLEDCRDKYNNVINFQGEPHLPGTDFLTKPVNS